MNLINRAAIVVYPKQPYLAWAAQLSEDEGVAGLARSDLGSVYLADEEDSPDDILQRHFERIFEEELWSWHRDESAWPKDRSFQVFSEWFDAVVLDMVWDLGEGRIIREDG